MEEKEEEVVVAVVVVVVGVVDSIDGANEAWGCVIYLFLVKFTDGPMDRPTNGRTHPHIEVRGHIKKGKTQRRKNSKK